MMAQFKTVVINDFETSYIIYEDGRLFNTKTKNWLDGTISKAGYRVYAIRFNGKKTDQLAHRLVAKAFIPNPNNLPVVNHKDGDKLNNNISNLEWTTVEENNIHAVRLGLREASNNASARIKYDPSLDLPDEIWKPYKENYLVSNCGRIRNTKTGNLLKGRIRGDGYVEQNLSLSTGKEYPMAHRVVYQMFVGPLDPTKVINHIDGNRTNNNITNLEQITQQQNVHHSYYITKTNTKTKEVGKYNLEDELLEVYPSCAEAARQNPGCYSNHIVNVCNGKKKTHHGYKWKYINEE